MYKYNFINFDGELVEVEITKEMQEIINDFDENEERERYRYRKLNYYCDREIYENHLDLSECEIENILDDLAFERKIEKILSTCTETQSRRFKLFLYNRMNYTEIARCENVRLYVVQKCLKEVFVKIKKEFLK